MNQKFVDEYLKSFSGIKIADVGDYLSEGGQHYVYKYQTDKVIKIPKHSFFMWLYGYYDSTQMYEDLILSRETFKEYLIESDMLFADNKTKYVVIQKFLTNAKPLTLANLQQVKDQLNEIVIQNKMLLKQEKQCFDFISFFGFFQCLIATLTRNKSKAVMENLMVYEYNGNFSLQIIDFNLLEVKLWNPRVNPIHWIVDMFFVFMYRVLIRDNFGVKI